MDLAVWKKAIAIRVEDCWNVLAFGESKPLSEWFTDERCGCASMPAFRYRLRSGMTETEAIEQPRKQKRALAIEPGTRRGKLVVGTQTRIGLHGREVLCNCDCGQQAWRAIQGLLTPRYSSCGCSRRRLVSEEKKKERNRRWEAANRDHRREYLRKWKEDHPESVSRSGYIRRLTENSATDKSAIRDIYKLAKSQLPVVCHLCGRITLHKAERQVDHRIPAIRGGGHFPQNLAVVCAECNSKKHAKTELEFLLLEHHIEEPLSIG